MSSFGKEIIALIVRDFNKVMVYFFHVETPPGVCRCYSLLLAPYLGTE